MNILVGRNGQGKTNLLEAIYFLATTKSFRTPRVASLFRFESANVFASGILNRSGLEKNLSVGLRADEPRRRVLMINGERVTLPVYLNAMSVFAYCAARLEILRGAPEERRRFLDRGIASTNPTYLEQLTRYGRVLKQRNALLHAIAAGKASPSQLQPWDDELIMAAVPIYRARAGYAGALSSAYQAIALEHRYRVTGLSMTYQPGGLESMESLEEQLGDRLRRHRGAEIRARVSLCGPQRDGLDFVLDGRLASEVLSGGEQKMVVLFLKFAKLELFRRRHDEPAIFLLDDIDAELDLEILEQLLARMPASTQVFATSAKESFLRSLEAGPHRRLTLENGEVTAVRDY